MKCATIVSIFAIVLAAIMLNSDVQAAPEGHPARVDEVSLNNLVDELAQETHRTGQEHYRAKRQSCNGCDRNCKALGFKRGICNNNQCLCQT